MRAGLSAPLQELCPPWLAHCFLWDALLEARAAQSVVSFGDFRAETHGFRTWGLLAITGGAVMMMLVWLKGVFLPVVLAAFLTLLFEPLLSFLSRPARYIARRRAERPGRLLSALEAAISAVAVGICILLAAVIVATCIFLIFRSIASADFNKYKDSKRLESIMRSIEGMDVGKPATEVAVFFGSVILSVISVTLLMVLFLAFMLVSLAGANTNADPSSSSSQRPWGVSSKVKTSVQRYICIRVSLSAIVGAVVWCIYSLVGVDLAFLFAFLTFLLNHIPHIGYTISVLLPLPLIILDPTKTWGDVVSGLVWPLLVHQIVSNMIEPRLLATSLQLHPVAVLASLVFWMMCWGPVGAALSAPLTCMFRIGLSQVDHPAAAAVISALEGTLTFHKRRSVRSRSNSNSGS